MNGVTKHHWWAAMSEGWGQINRGVKQVVKGHGHFYAVWNNTKNLLFEPERSQAGGRSTLCHPLPSYPLQDGTFFLEGNKVITSRKNDCKVRKQNNRSKPWAFLFLCYIEMKLLLAGDSGSKKWNITAPFCNPSQLYPTKNVSEALGSYMTLT